MAAKRPHPMRKAIRISWILFSITLALTLLAEVLFFHQENKEKALSATPFFHAWFGFAACAVIVLVSKLLGFFLKRSEEYYDNS